MALAKSENRWDRIAAMNRAASRKPTSGGKTYKAPKRRHHDPAPGSWDRLLTETRARWHHAAGDALQGYQWAVNPSAADVEEFFANGGTL